MSINQCITMKLSSKLILPFFLSACLAEGQVPQVAKGRLIRIENFHSEFVTARNIDIWLPKGYSEREKYAVLYMHDGQMLFDPNTTWNKQAWNADDVASGLMKSRKIRKFIVVGIWNGGATRHADYFPQKPFEQLSQQQKDTVTARLQKMGRTTEIFRPCSDQYLKFIVKELKPYIDQHYSVAGDRENTFIAGSSMGGLISMYAICEYPEIFGGAACLSTHWPGIFSIENNPVPDAFLRYMMEKLPDPETHKIYFDCGDQTLDALYPPIQQKVDSVMISRGYHQSDWMTQYFPGADHSEKSWSERLHIPLKFLFEKTP